MRVMERRLAPFIALVAGVSACLAGAVPSTAHGIDVQTVYPVAAIGPSGIFSTPTADGTTYYASAKGLFRSTDPTYATWTRPSALSGINALSARADRPNDLVYADQVGIHRSLDGGAHAALVSHCTADSVARSVANPAVLYAARDNVTSCPLPNGAGNYPVRAQVLKSSDDGLTWSVVLTTTDYYSDFGGFWPLAVDPADPNHAVVGETLQSVGRAYVTFDGGHSWSPFDWHNTDGSYVTALAIDPVTHDFWSGWGSDLEHDIQVVLAGEGNAVAGIAFDPLSGRAYAVRSADLVADQGNGNVQPLPLNIPSQGRDLAVTPNGTLLVSTHDNAPTVYRITAPGVWPLAATMAGSPMVRLLGGPLSPLQLCGADFCQYFDKGALDSWTSGAYTVMPLVPALLNTRSSLPVSGNTSTVTYRTLYALHSRRTPMPSGFTGGTRAVPGGTFVPYSPTLAPASGYVVPTVFWRYLSNPHTAPGGWQAAIGLPLTPAVPATVSKGKLGTRTILIQAFQRAILTYDPRNAVPFRVERANIGADDAALFPAAVR